VKRVVSDRFSVVGFQKKEETEDSTETQRARRFLREETSGGKALKKGKRESGKT
jgi:hypothetical protein